MSEQLRARLFAALDAVRLIDPHTHINAHAPASTTLADILGYHYYTELAHSAGMPKARIEERSGQVFLVNQGSLYPALHRLEREKLIKAEWGASDNNRRARFYEITAKGSQLTVVLNGQKTVDVQDSKHAAGPFALQYGSGVIKFRKVYIKPL